MVLRTCIDSVEWLFFCKLVSLYNQYLLAKTTNHPQWHQVICLCNLLDYLSFQTDKSCIKLVVLGKIYDHVIGLSTLISNSALSLRGPTSGNYSNVHVRSWGLCSRDSGTQYGGLNVLDTPSKLTLYGAYESWLCWALLCFTLANNYIDCTNWFCNKYWVVSEFKEFFLCV